MLQLNIEQLKHTNITKKQYSTEQIFQARMGQLQWRVWSTILILLTFFILITINAYSKLRESNLDTTIEKRLLISATALGPLVIVSSICLVHKLG